MFSSAKVDIVTNSSGAAEVYLQQGVNNGLNGFLICLKYAPGTIETGAVLTITGESSGIPIMTKTGAGTSTVFYYPRALLNAVVDGAEGTTPSEFIPIKNERIKIVVASGGDTKTGSIEAWIANNPPY